jgi:hypothetical protein
MAVQENKPDLKFRLTLLRIFIETLESKGKITAEERSYMVSLFDKEG